MNPDTPKADSGSLLAPIELFPFIFIIYICLYMYLNSVFSAHYKLKGGPPFTFSSQPFTFLPPSTFFH